MGQQLEQVQKDLQIVRDRLRTMAADHKTNSSDGKQHGESFDGFASVEESRAYEYAATAVEVRVCTTVLQRQLSMNGLASVE